MKKRIVFLLGLSLLLVSMAYAQSCGSNDPTDLEIVLNSPSSLSPSFGEEIIVEVIVTNKGPCTSSSVPKIKYVLADTARHTYPNIDVYRNFGTSTDTIHTTIQELQPGESVTVSQEYTIPKHLYERDAYDFIVQLSNGGKGDTDVSNNEVIVTIRGMPRPQGSDSNFVFIAPNPFSTGTTLQTLDPRTGSRSSFAGHTVTATFITENAGIIATDSNTQLLVTLKDDEGNELPVIDGLSGSLSTRTGYPLFGDAPPGAVARGHEYRLTLPTEGKLFDTYTIDFQLRDNNDLTLSNNKGTLTITCNGCAAQSTSTIVEPITMSNSAGISSASTTATLGSTIASGTAISPTLTTTIPTTTTTTSKSVDMTIENIQVSSTGSTLHIMFDTVNLGTSDATGFEFATVLYNPVNGNSVESTEVLETIRRHAGGERTTNSVQIDTSTIPAGDYALTIAVGQEGMETIEKTINNNFFAGNSLHTFLTTTPLPGDVTYYPYLDITIPLTGTSSGIPITNPSIPTTTNRVNPLAKLPGGQQKKSSNSVRLSMTMDDGDAFATYKHYWENLFVDEGTCFDNLEFNVIAWDDGATVWRVPGTQYFWDDTTNTYEIDTSQDPNYEPRSHDLLYIEVEEPTSNGCTFSAELENLDDFTSSDQILLSGPFNIYRVTKEMVVSGSQGVTTKTALETLHPTCDVINAELYGAKSGTPFVLSVLEDYAEEYQALATILVIECA